MNKKGNNRGKESKERLKNSILNLLDHGRLIQEITVMEVCNEANLNRSTFYSHYKIPADILEEIEEETIKSLAETLKNFSTNSIEDIISELRFIKEKRKIFNILYLHSRSYNFSDKFATLSINIMDEIKDSITDKTVIPYFYSYVLEGSRSIIFRWIQNNFTESEEYVASLLYSFNDVVLKSISS